MYCCVCVCVCVCYLRHPVTFKRMRLKDRVVWPFSFRDQTLCFSDMLFLIHEFWPAHTHTVHSTMNENKPLSRMEWQRRQSVFRTNTNRSDDVSRSFLRENRSFRTWCHDPLKHALVGGHGKDGPWALLLRHSRRKTNNLERPCLRRRSPLLVLLPHQLFKVQISFSSHFCQNPFQKA